MSAGQGERVMKQLCLVVVLIGGVVATGWAQTLAELVNDGKNTENVTTQSMGYDRKSYSPLKHINTSNIKRLVPVWSTSVMNDLGELAAPTVYNGVMYVINGKWTFALDVATGRQIWRTPVELEPGTTTAAINRGAATIYNGKVFRVTVDNHVVALDMKTGQQVWKQKFASRQEGYFATSAPIVANGVLISGMAGGESTTRGFLDGWDPETGRKLWRRHTIPAPGEPGSETWPKGSDAWKYGGAPTWRSGAYDPELDLVYWGTGNAEPYDPKPRGALDSLYASSVLAIRPKTGEIACYFQYTPNDVYDVDGNDEQVLVDVGVNGQLRKAMIQANKNGFLYVLDRTNCTLIAAHPYVKVNWATHINLETGRPVYDPAGEYWNRPEGESVAVWPNMWGAHSWNPMAWHPGERLAYIPVVDIPSISTYHGGDEYSDTLEMMTEVDGKPFSPGKLLAWDPVTQSARWTVNRPYPFNGGVMATAGGLVFQGDALGAFEAYAASNGELLWRVMTGTAITAAPVSYVVGGKQHVLIPVGAGGGVQFAYPELHAGDRPQGPTRLMAFTLGSPLEVPAVVVAPRQLPEQPPLQATSGQIEQGHELYSDNCSGCHGKNGIARFGGTVPDLRYSAKDVHDAWPAIVIGGARSANGMPSFELELDEAEAIRNYVLSLSVDLRNARGGSE